MKKITIICTILLSSFCSQSQEIINPPGLDKFWGNWIYISGQDTIRMMAYSYYSGDSYMLVKGLRFFYSYKQGANIIWDNYNNWTDKNKSDFGGTKTTGTNLEKLRVVGEDNLKRKYDGGYLVLNAAGDRLTFTRNADLAGGLRHHAPGQGPLPGYTLPDTFTLTKIPVQMDERLGHH